MKMYISKASDDDWYEIKEISTLKDLVDLMEKYGSDLILSQNIRKYMGNADLHVTIYDDYVE